MTRHIAYSIQKLFAYALVCCALSTVPAHATLLEMPDGYKAIPTQFIAALGNPEANSGKREITTTLKVHAKASDGTQRWELGDDAALIDVTHMPCRSARYTPLNDSEPNCSPANADLSQWKVSPGSPMPEIMGCHKQDYAVLIVIGMKE